jgi:hypothetical protein
VSCWLLKLEVQAPLKQARHHSELVGPAGDSHPSLHGGDAVAGALHLRALQADPAVVALLVAQRQTIGQSLGVGLAQAATLE